jgi:coenzyme Q-binding protein COQ10
VDVVYHEGPFRHLTNHWTFEPDDRGNCIIDFYIDFEFRSRTLQKLIGRLFNEAVQRMVNGFEKRARSLYGSTKDHPRRSGSSDGSSSGKPLDQ